MDGGRRTDGKPQGWVERVFWIPHLARSDSYTKHAFSRHSRTLLSQIIQTFRIVSVMLSRSSGSSGKVRSSKLTGSPRTFACAVRSSMDVLTKVSV